MQTDTILAIASGLVLGVPLGYVIGVVVFRLLIRNEYVALTAVMFISSVFAPVVVIGELPISRVELQSFHRTMFTTLFVVYLAVLLTRVFKPVKINGKKGG